MNWAWKKLDTNWQKYPKFVKKSAKKVIPNTPPPNKILDSGGGGDFSPNEGPGAEKIYGRWGQASEIYPSGPPSSPNPQWFLRFG